MKHSELLLTLFALFLCRCTNSGDQLNNEDLGTTSTPVVIESIVPTAEDSCFVYLEQHMASMNTRNAALAIESLRNYSLYCRRDTLLWVSGMLEISKTIYKSPDSVILYAEMMLRRDDYNRHLTKDQLLLNLALAHDLKGSLDSACYYLQILKESGRDSEYQKSYSNRLRYCFD